jgi:hypothetical protein
MMEKSHDIDEEDVLATTERPKCPCPCLRRVIMHELVHIQSCSESSSEKVSLLRRSR